MTLDEDLRRALATLAFVAASVAPVRALPAGLRWSGWPDPATDSVSPGGDKADVAYSLANGFPLWIEDANGVRLELCLDQHATATADSAAMTPCLTAEPFRSAPLTFPDNFGTEAPWWSATAFTLFTSALDGRPITGDALLVLAQEASFSDLLVSGDRQVAFGRIRVRLNVPVPGTYRVTHPYGEIDYVVTSVTAGREINQTRDIGNIASGDAAGPPPIGDFTLALGEGAAPPEPLPPFDPAFNAGIVSRTAVGIGPFLVPAGPLVAATNGATYLSDPGSDLVPRTVPVTGSPMGTNFFRVQLLDPPPGFVLNAIAGTQEILVTEFQLVGKLLEAGPNLPPVAMDDHAATPPGTHVFVDVLANDVDVVDDSNTHGIHPQALALPSDTAADPPGTLLITRALTTRGGGTVKRVTAFDTGKTMFDYVPAPGFVGDDSFDYVVQDTGGLVSNRARVTITVERLAVERAEYRARNGKWRVSGTTSDAARNAVTITTGPRASLKGNGVAPAVSTAAAGSAALRLRDDRIEYAVALDPLPDTSVADVLLRLGAPGENGPALFVLYDSVIHGDFTGTWAGTLLPHRLLYAPDTDVFSLADAVRAISAGRAYVEVRTTRWPSGELRGQLSSTVVGTAPVDADGRWHFEGRSRAAPGGAPASVDATSARGVSARGAPLLWR